MGVRNEIRGRSPLAVCGGAVASRAALARTETERVVTAQAPLRARGRGAAQRRSTPRALFRDPAAWARLADQAIEPLVAGKKDGDAVRAWVPACATGEDAYSLAILLDEAARREGRSCRIRVFATDVDAAAVDAARAARYPARSLRQVSPERRARYFEPEGRLFRVRRELRDCIVFACHDPTRDPPFSRLDVASCREMVSELEPAQRGRVLRLLHFALVPGGVLFLGGPDACLVDPNLFAVVSGRARLYRRVGATRYHGHDLRFDPARAREGASAAGRWARAAGLRDQDLDRLDEARAPRRSRPDRPPEDVESSLDELRRSTEEMLTLNEELEASQEQLHGLNEELRVANAQLEARVHELERAYDDLDNLMRSTNVPTLFLDRQMRVRSFTPSVADLFRLTPADVARPIAHLVPTLDDPQLLRDAERVARTRVPREAEVRTQDGHWYMRQILPYRTRDGRVDGLVVTLSDVAASVVREARLHAESVVAAAPDAILTLDGRGTILSVNAACEVIFGHAASDMVGRSMARLLADGRVLREALRRTDAGALRTVHDTEGRRRDGETFPMEIILSAFEAGAGPRLVAIVRDVSVRLAQESERRDHVAELAHAQRLSTVGELASGFAHEIGQPLMAIANDIDAAGRLLRTGAGKAHVLELLARASDEAVHAGDVVHRLREFLRKRSGRPAPFDLGEVVAESVRLVASEAERAAVVLRSEPAPGPLPVFGDRVQMKQVVVNLLQNAVEALRERTPRDGTIDLRVAPATRGQIEIVVEDDGPGLAPALAGTLFDPFVTTKPEGLGLGLSISRSIVEQHHGTLEVADRSDGRPGVRARVTLPAAGAGGRHAR